MIPISCRVVDVIQEGASCSTILLENALPDVVGVPIPGQFVMVWVRGVDEIPMAVSHFDGETIGITVQDVGECTHALREVKVGDTLGVRGFFGNGFTLTGERALLIAGGIGSAPLAYLSSVLAEQGADITVCMGARKKRDISLQKSFHGKVMIATEDGSAGIKGMVTDLLDELTLEDFDRIYCCGPERMMYAVFERVCKADMLNHSEFSLHRYIKCGLGICGACCIDPEGLRVCRDGPVFSGDTL